VKLVSDFDGVWTFPDAEAEAQGEILDAMLEAALPEELRDRGREWIGAARAAVAANPQRYGWRVNGRLSAFGDEDPFTAHNGLLDFTLAAAATDPIARAIRAGFERSGQALERAGGESHTRGVERVVAARGPAMAAGARDAGQRLLDAGIETVVVSNSPDEKLGEWFGSAGITSRSHPDGGAREFRLRGRSRKFEIDPERSEMLRLGELAIETARPVYERVLREERPDAVVGDVFSLDVALPLRLKRTEPEWRDLRVLWFVQPYTPRWLRAEVEWYAGNEIECVEGGLAGLAAILVR